MKKINLCSVALIGAMGLFSNVSANEVGVNFQLTGTSDYVLRGVSQTSDKAAVFGDVTVSYANFFAGIWAANVDFSKFGVTDADTEVDYYAGYANEFKNFEYSAAYARYTYPGSKNIDDIDELKFDLGYRYDKFKIGGKYEIGTWNENKNAKLDYVEGYASYDFDILTLGLAAGSYEKVGDNITLALSKAGEFAGQNVEFRVKYSDFNADSKGAYEDEKNLFAEVVFTF